MQSAAASFWRVELVLLLFSLLRLKTTPEVFCVVWVWELPAVKRMQAAGTATTNRSNASTSTTVPERQPQPPRREGVP